MTRRNLLLATTTPPSTGLQFPVYLVEGDNGQLGVDVYNYFTETYPYGWHDDSILVYCNNLPMVGYLSYWLDNQYIFSSGGISFYYLYPSGIVEKFTNSGYE